MRAVGVPRFGGPEVLEVVELPEPVAGEGEVRIRVAAATVNPTDIGLRDGRRAEALKDLPPPWVPGMELAGEIDAVGPGGHWSAGQQVIAIVVPFRPLGGAQAELVVVAGESVAEVPDGATLEQAATLPMNGLTVRRAFDLLALDAGQTLAVTGSAGAVGGYAIELAKLEGLRVVADAAPADEALVRGFGADIVVARGEGCAQAIRAAIPGGVDAVLDAALLGPAILPAVRDGGQLAAVRAFGGERARHRDPGGRGGRLRHQPGGAARARPPSRSRPADLARRRDLCARARRGCPPQARGRRRARPAADHLLRAGVRRRAGGGAAAVL